MTQFKKRYELKRCPFCGGEPYLEHDSRAFMDGVLHRVSYVRCKSCSARSGKFIRKQFTPQRLAEEAAAKAWNTRIGEEA